MRMEHDREKNSPIFVTVERAAIGLDHSISQNKTAAGTYILRGGTKSREKIGKY